MDKEQAIKLAESKWWEHAEARDIAAFQLQEEKLCLPFDVFHKAVEEAIGRPVWTHEFAGPEHLLAELKGEVPHRTFQEILELIPAEKRVIVFDTRE